MEFKVAGFNWLLRKSFFLLIFGLQVQVLLEHRASVRHIGGFLLETC